jgi:ribonuclease D
MDKPINQDTDYILITDNQQLNQFCTDWKNKAYLALDTEFMRVDSFYPKAALFQINDGESNFLIDPLSITDWESFIELMLSEQTTKIFHSCSEDLLVFIRLFGILPQPVFDTQIANAFLNKGFALSYQNMVLEELGIEVPKGETRSNWLQRPLSTQQQEYAALDVAYLPEIYLEQKEKLIATDRLSWVEEDCARLLGNYNDELNQDFSQVYRNMGAAWQLDKQQLVILKALAEWREKRARERDKPRNWIIKDKELITIAKNIPETLEQLGQINGLNTNFLHYEGETLLRLIQDNLNAEPAALLEPVPRPLSNGQKKTFKKAQALVERVAQELNLPIEILGRKRTLISLYQEVLSLKNSRLEKPVALHEIRLPDELNGWRKSVLLEKLLATFQLEVST